jgi:aryl-alcohol dehydrogenase-like predicted oxidoreductase
MSETGPPQIGGTPHRAPSFPRFLRLSSRIAEVADDAGMSLLERAIAFVINHPAVTSAIIGPRTMEQLDN